MISPPSKLKMFTGSVCVLLTSVSLKLIKIKIKFTREFVRKKQNGGWKLSDTDWFYFSFYSRSCFFSIIRFFFYDPSWSESNFILFFFSSIRVGPSRSELIPPGLASELIRSDLYLPVLKYQKLHIFRSRFTHLAGGPSIFGFLLVSLFWSWLKEAN